MLALRGYNVCCAQLSHHLAFRFGRRLFRCFVPMANVMKPFVLFIPMATAIKPVRFKLLRAYSGLIPMANAIEPMVPVILLWQTLSTNMLLFIPMANVINQFRVLISACLFMVYPNGKRYKINGSGFTAMANTIKQMVPNLLRWQMI